MGSVKLMTFAKGYLKFCLAEHWNTLHAVGVESEITKLGYAECVSTLVMVSAEIKELTFRLVENPYYV